MLVVCEVMHISADPSSNVTSDAKDDKDAKDKEKEKTEKQMKNIADGIDKASKALKNIRNLMTTTKAPNIKFSLDLMVEFYSLGGVIFPQLKVFSSSLALLNGLIDGGGSGDDKVTKGILYDITLYIYDSEYII